MIWSLPLVQQSPMPNRLLTAVPATKVAVGFERFAVQGQLGI